MRTEDGYIVHKCLNGDPEAFGLLVDKYKAGIHALAYSKIRNFHDAEDVTQEAFIKAYKKLHTLKRQDSFLAWIYSITSNLCKNWIRAKSRRPDSELIEDQNPKLLAHTSTGFYREDPVSELIREALDSLPEIYREALTFRYLGDMSIKEIAKFLGMSPHVVEMRLSRARAKLRQEVLIMISATFEQAKLHPAFTFRIVEIVKKIRTRPFPPTPWLPWGMSLVTGAMLTLLGFISFWASISLNLDPISLATPIEAKVLELGEIPVDVLEVSKVPIFPSQNDGKVGSRTASTNISNSPNAFLVALQEKTSSGSEKEKTTISGKVLKDGAPVSNAQVYIYDQDTKMKYATTTLADGTFQLEIPKPDGKKWERLIAIAHNSQHSFGWARFTEKETTSVIVQLRNPMTISGTILDESGNPVPGAEAKITWLSIPTATGSLWKDDLPENAIPPQFSSVKTDANGYFVLRYIPEGSTSTLHLLSPGYATEVRYSIQSGIERLTFKLKREGRIEGKVTFGDSSKAAKGIKIAAQGLHPTPPPGWFTAQTDENGYSLTNLPAGSYNVGLEEAMPDWTVVAREHIKVFEGQKVKNVDLKLVKGGFIAGRVTDKDTNEPIPGHWIGFHDAARPESQAAIFSAHTDENGFYRFRAAPGRAMVYTSSPEGYAGSESVAQVKKYVNVVEGETGSEVNFEFYKRVDAIKLVGSVLSFDGNPVAGAQITDNTEWPRMYATSDRDGKFTIGGLKKGQKLSLKAEQIKMRLRGYANVEVQPDAEVKIVMEKYETTSASGRVVDRQGNPISSASIELIKWDKEPRRGIGSAAAAADGSGKYKITGLIVGDEYSISAEAEGYRKAGTNGFTAKTDMPPLEDIVLPHAGRFFLEGKVTDTDGKSVVGALLTASSTHNQVSTDVNGYYRLDNLPFSVEVEISIQHPDYGYSRFRYVTTDRAENFVLVKADRYLLGKVVDTDGNPVDNASVHVESDDEASGHINMSVRTNFQGEFRLKNIVGEKISIYVGKERLYKVFKDVKTNRDDVVFVLKPEEPSEPPKPPTAEETAKWEYVKSAEERFKELKGKAAPELDVAQWLQGDESIRLSELKRRADIVVLHFWSHRSAQAVEAIRLLNILQREYGNKGLICIGIHESIDQVDELKKILEERKFSYPLYPFAVDKKSSVLGARGVTFDKYAVVGWPTRFIIIDRQGMVWDNVWDRYLEEKIQELISK